MLAECGKQNGHAELYTSYSDHMLWGELSINDKDRVVMWPSEAQDTALESLQAGSKKRFHWFCLSGTEGRRCCSSWRPQHTIWQRHQQAPSRCSNCRSCRSLNQSFTRRRGERERKKKSNGYLWRRTGLENWEAVYHQEQTWNEQHCSLTVLYMTILSLRVCD